jgi:MoxR-like ATPase
MSANKLIDRNRTASLAPDFVLPLPFVADQGDPGDYVMDQGLEDAANTALDLGQPLLLTGEPGTGKTQFAAFLAAHLGLGKPLEFHTKSISVATDLFYTYDTVRRFHAAHSSQDKDAVDEREYIRFNALGKAILRSLPAAEIKDICRDRDTDLRDGPKRSVVLIDEIDKASRDFPNDLLNELTKMSFLIPELGRTVTAQAAFRPIVVITSNQERPLPDAFLRRCVFYCIDPPDEARLTRILALRFGLSDKTPPPLLRSATNYYFKAREGEHRAPSVAELVGWFHLLKKHGADLNGTIAAAVAQAERGVAALAKTPPARRFLRDLMESAR